MLISLFPHQQWLRNCALQVLDLRKVCVFVEWRRGLRTVVLVIEYVTGLERLFLQAKDIFTLVYSRGKHSAAIINVIHYLIKSEYYNK